MSTTLVLVIAETIMIMMMRRMRERMAISPAHCTDRFVQPIVHNNKEETRVVLRKSVNLSFFLERGETDAGNKCDYYDILGRSDGLKSERE